MPKKSVFCFTVPNDESFNEVENFFHLGEIKSTLNKLPSHKFIEKKFSINYQDILIKNLDEYNEILLVGSGKGVISANKVQGTNWRRNSWKYYKILNNFYKKAVTKCPRYYG